MKTYSEVLSESVELYEAWYNPLSWFRDRRRIEREMEDAVRKGPAEAEKAQVSISKEIILGFLGTIRNHPRKYLALLGIVMGDLAQSKYTGTSGTGLLLGAVRDGMSAQLAQAGADLQSTVKNDILTTDNIMFLSLLGAVGFSSIAIFNLLKIVAVRGPKWLEAKLATRDNKQLAYIMKKELGVDIHTQDVRVGSPGRSKIMDPA